MTLERLQREFGDMVSVSKPNGRLAYFVIPVQRIPKTTSGKVQRGKLLEAYIDGELSKDRRIGPDDNLFEVGVSSLTLTEIVLAIDEKYPGKLDISDLFDYPTLRAIAAFLERNTK